MLEILGYPADFGPGRVRTWVLDGLEDVRARARSAAVYRRVPVESNGGRILVDGRLPLESKLLKKVFQPCTHALVFVATLGPGVDELIAGAEEDRVSEAFVLDAIASHMAEKVADRVERELAGALAPGEGATLRYSPGYCDWPVGGQRLVFSVVDGDSIGVSLTGHCLMRPRKSLSGVIGVGPRDLVEKEGNACRFCKRADCEHRRSVMQ
jgi:hypothetical protein